MEEMWYAQLPGQFSLRINYHDGIYKKIAYSAYQVPVLEQSEEDTDTKKALEYLLVEHSDEKASSCSATGQHKILWKQIKEFLHLDIESAAGGRKHTKQQLKVDGIFL